MSKPPTTKPIPGQLTLFGFTEFVPVGDNTFKAVQRAPVPMVSITQAARIAGKTRDNIYRLFRRNFITGDQSSPGKIQINLESLHAHLEASREPDFWNEARRKQYRGDDK